MTKDGRRRLIEWSITVLKGKGNSVYMILTGVDMTHRKLTEERLKRTAEDLTRPNKELEQFAYVASHDLQEPLRMVASYTQLLAQRYKGKLGKDADEFISYASEGAQRSQRLINDLLEYSRVRTRGKSFQQVDLNMVLERTLSNLKMTLIDSGGTVTFDELPVIMADDVQLLQLMQNLIENAIKFRKKDPPQIHIKAVPYAGLGPEKQWRISIQDNGIGIEPQYVERIFIMFQRLHTHEEYEGNGIGLAICKRIVERHGGKIWVESKPGEGSLFSFTIPCISLPQGNGLSESRASQSIAH